MKETLTAAESAKRADVYLTNATEYSRSFLKTLFERGKVFINGKAASAGDKLRAGDEIELLVPEPEPLTAAPEDIPIDIVYEDGAIAVVNKARGMVVHPAAGNPSGTLVNALMFRLDGLSGINGVLRPGIVHRLDRDTSGLLVVAKTDDAHRSLSEQIKEKTAGRTYIALVNGNIKEDSGVIDLPIGRHHTDRKKMAVVREGRRAVTHYEVLRRYGRYTLVLARLETGRTHQIRVHFAHNGHSVVGDGVYGAPKNEFGVEGQLLHAARLSLIHPATGERVTFFAPPPEVFKRALAECERKYAK